MKALMASLREKPLDSLAGTEVTVRKDYLTGIKTDVKTGETEEMELRESNVLGYALADGTTVIVRPSGTEPKVKIYVLANGASQGACEEKVQKYARWAEGLAK